MDKQKVIRAGARIAKALAGLSPREVSMAIAAGKEVLKFTSEIEGNNGEPVLANAIERVPAGIFWATAYVSGLERIAHFTGKNGNKQMIKKQGDAK